MGKQASEYKALNIVDRVGDLPGANRESDSLDIIILEQPIDTDVQDDDSRQVGIVSVDGTTLVQEDTPLDVSATELDVDLNSQTLGEVVTDIATALGANAGDHLLVQEDTPLDVSATELDVDLNSQTLGEVVTDIATALGANAGDHLLVQEDTPLDVSGAVVSIQEDSPLDVSASEVDVDIATQSLGSLATDIATALGANAGDHLLVQQDNPLDVSGATVTTAPSNNDESAATGTTVAASSSATLATLSASGAERLIGQVTATGGYDLTVEWLDSAGGSVVRTETVATGVASGTWTDIDLPTRSPHCNIVVTDTSGADQTADHTAHMA